MRILLFFKWIWWRLFSKARLQKLYAKNWAKFTLENRVKIDQWMKTHDEDQKLPVVRSPDGEFRWLGRAERRGRERLLSKYK